MLSILLAGTGPATLTAQGAAPDGRGSDNQAAASDTQDGPESPHRGGDGDTKGKDGKKPPVPEAEAFDEPSADPRPDVPGERSVSPDEPLIPLANPDGVSQREVAKIRETISANGWARVNVTVTPPRSLTTRAGRAQQADVARALDALAQRVAGRGARELSRIKVYPFATYRVTGAGLNRLLADPEVTSVAEDGFATATLDVSTGVIDSDLLNAAGTNGDGWSGSPVGAQEVAIIDSGVDNDHAAFAGRVVAEACRSANSNCPNGATTQDGADAGENCTHSTDCDHGTHVASIAAGTSFTGGHEGVARGARIIAVNVASDGSGSQWTAFFSDIIAGLQFVLDRRNSGANVVSANMSIGIDGFAQEGVCDSNNANFTATQAVAANLQNGGVAVIAAAGNSNLVGSSYPACLTSVYSVSATNDSDVPAGFTNSGTSTDWWAPGVDIDAAVPGTDTHANKSGTSMAAPHVAGAFGLLRECVDGNGVQITNANAVARLNATGVNVTDNGATRRRINVLDAATGLVNNNDFANAETLPATAFNDFDFNICSDTEPGEPGPFSLDNGVWWNWTPTTTGLATVSTEDGGGNVTTFDTTLTVYTGNTLGTLEVVEADDDSGTGLRSLVTFLANAGTTYRIKVDGFGAATGLLNLHSEINPVTCQGATPTVFGTAGDDTITGTAGDDVIVAGEGEDVINSGGGNDRVCGDEGDDTVNGGGGNDTVYGGPEADTIQGGPGSDVLLGNQGGGDLDDVGDTLNGGAGDDTLDGWVGNDRLIGGEDNDSLVGADGTDIAEYGGSPSAVTVNLTNSSSSGGHGSDDFFGVENLLGSAFDDSLTGDGAANQLNGQLGSDKLGGLGGNDELLGGADVDTLIPGGGDDTVNGGALADLVSFAVSPAGVTVNLISGTATGEGTDALAGIEDVTGSPHNDTIDGNAVINVLAGLAGADIIRGSAQDDRLLGGLGNDFMRGGTGDDFLQGNENDDRLFGDAGQDDCHGSTGVDTQTACETVTGVP
ncbi:S8 family serine peptidase [Nocardioides antri]|uniref:S8 family serine peptidase n=1 Tax=Nocardioides antri TaxID=2607659 RepID=A0A5B1M764_9ACTN|nr:S8 family serine peptidase [Nocardioides antri]KAA1429105.1 S8 family serine peptidase [Nocardioides antri]